MEIDVIIPLYKPGKELFTLLDKLDSQSVPVHEVILLNTGEKYFEQLIYGTRFLEKYQNIKVYHVSKREFDHGGTRRMGVKKSSADIFVMMTQDAMPADDNLIEQLTEPLRDQVAVSYARQLPREDCAPGNLIIRHSHGSNPQKILRHWGSRHFSAPMCVRHTDGRSMRNWVDS